MLISYLALSKLPSPCSNFNCFSTYTLAGLKGHIHNTVVKPDVLVFLFTVCTLISAEVSLSLLDFVGLELFDCLGGPCFCIVLFVDLVILHNNF